ncbi:unnamed protein product [Sphagnum troendelagicum]|uniref:Uncharacterized protein n=1 Tax=Sphagnum troendelagicum TaxID=128251 RepID=A0ABP0TKH6_9BRYO
MSRLSTRERTKAARDALASLGHTRDTLHVDAFAAPSAAASSPLRHARPHIPSVRPSSQFRSFAAFQLRAFAVLLQTPACLPAWPSIDRAFYKFLNDVRLIAFSSS